MLAKTWMVIEDICGATTRNMSVRFYTKLAFFAIVASGSVGLSIEGSNQCGRLLNAW